MLKPTVIRHGFMPDENLALPTTTDQPSIRARWTTLVHGWSLSRAQAIIGTLTGIVTIVGAVVSVVQFAHPAGTGNLVTIVQTTGTRGSVTDATVEVLTTENALVATLTPDATGRVAQELREGVYVVRVSHPKYAADTRRVQVLPRQTVEVRTSLRSGSSSPTSIDRAVNGGVSALRRALRF
jgi:ribosomal protein S28E/S33